MVGTVIALLCGGLPFLIGLLMVFLAVAEFFKNIKLKINSKKAQGKVVEMPARRGSGKNPGTVYTPVFEFVTLEGKAMKVADPVANNPPRYEIGDMVDVVYDSKHPENAYIDDAVNARFRPTWIISALGGVAIMCLGITMALAILNELGLLP